MTTTMPQSALAARRDTSARLPFGVGSPGPMFVAALALAALAALVGLGAWLYQFREGEVVTGLRDLGPMGGVTWGLYIIFVIYFIGVSFAGITVAALIRLMNLEFLRPVARMAQALTVVSLMVGGLAVLADLGQPGRGIINLLRYARPQSPFFGTFSLVIAGLLFASLIYLYLDGRRDASVLARRASPLRGWFRFWSAGYSDTPAERERHSRATFWLALAVIPLLVAALSTEGFVFGIQSSAAGWGSALQAPAFVVWGGVSGVGHLIVMAALARRLLHLEDELPLRIFSWLGNLLWVLIAIAGYFLLAEMLTSGYASGETEARVTDALWRGAYAPWFWGMVGLLGMSFVALFGQFVSKRYLISLTVAAAVLVNVAAILKRYLVVVPSQTHGRSLWYEIGSYSPTWVEFSIVIGLMGLGALMLLVFFKVFPVMHISASKEVE